MTPLESGGLQCLNTSELVAVLQLYSERVGVVAVLQPYFGRGGLSLCSNFALKGLDCRCFPTVMKCVGLKDYRCGLKAKKELLIE